MTAAVDKREYLVKLGLAKEGRGKFSNAAKEALAEAERNGIVFVDKQATVTTVRTADENGNVTEEKREFNPFAHHRPPMLTGMLDFVNASDRRKAKVQVNATEACAACSFSFGWCGCAIPTFRYWKTGEVLSLASRL